MNFKYNLSEKDYKKIIYQYNSRSNIVWIILSSLIFLITMQKLLLENLLIVFIAYIIEVSLMFLFLTIINKLSTNLFIKMSTKKVPVEYGTYDCKITKTKFVEKINNSEREIEFNDIKKIKKYKGMFIIFSKTKPFALIFKKDLFDDQTKYEELLELFTKKLKKD